MTIDLQTILSHASDTRDMALGQGILNQVAPMFKSQFPGKKAVVVAHTATWQVAGERVDQILRQAGIDTLQPIIFTDPHFHAEWCYIEQLDEKLSATDAIAVAVGSGSVNDICKRSSHNQGRPYMVVGTAASMDGYVASGASITKDGIKSTFACPAPRCIVADMDVVSTAPSHMTASGYADLFAKVPAGADWILADLFGYEPIDQTAWSIAQGGVKTALQDPAGCHNNDPAALQALTQGLLMGGFAMQAYPQSSRPASGADHQFSHMLNMDNFVMKNGEMPSHGFQVAVGTLIALFFYEKFLALDPDKWNIEAMAAAWPGKDALCADARQMFAGTDFAEFAAGEVAAKYVSQEAIVRELSILKDHWAELKEKLQAQLQSVSTARAKLKTVGAPTCAADIDLTPEAFHATILRSQRIRRRFTILDMAQHLGMLEAWAEEAAKALF